MFDASFHILCTDKLLKESQRFKEFGSMKFTESFIISIPIQDRDISEGAELIASVFKENVSELELDIINLQQNCH
jgi:hypothetical protein